MALGSQTFGHRLAWAAAVFVVTLAVYLPTVFPTASGGDATELATAACQLGVAHPPGYPLFTMIGHVAYRLLPFGDCAYRVNVMSAVLSAGTASAIFLCVYEWTAMEAGAVLAAGLFSFSPLVWAYAIQSEVFALNNFFAAAIFWLLARFEKQLAAVPPTSPSTASSALANVKPVGSGYKVTTSLEKLKGTKGPGPDTAASAPVYSRAVFHTTCQGALLCGLSLCNQHTIVLYVAPVAAWVAYASFKKQVLSVGRCFVYVACFAVGLAPYGYLAWASSRAMPGSWGDCTTWEGFLTHVLRREYGTLTLYSGSPSARSLVHMMEGINLFSHAFLRDSRFLGIYPTLLAMAMVTFRRPYASGGLRPPVQRSGLVVFACLSLYTLVFHYLANLPLDNPLFLGVQERFWLQGYVALFLLLGLGSSILLPHVTLALDRFTVRKLATLDAAVTEAIRAEQVRSRVSGDEIPTSKDAPSKKDKKERGAGKDREKEKEIVAAYAKSSAGCGHTDVASTTVPAGAAASSHTSHASQLARLQRWHADTILRRAVIIAAVLVFAHAGVAYLSADESANGLVLQYGKAHLDVLPQGARLIVKGDIITNTLRYLQQHHSYRTDVQMVDQSLLTYPWFIPVHGRSLPGFSFPGKFYHPRRSGGFSMREFLEANLDADKAPLYLAGGWNEEDNSQQGLVEEIPMGMVDLIVLAKSPEEKASEEAKQQHFKWLKGSARLLPNFTLPPPDFYGPERWETVVVKDYWGAHHRRAFHHLTWALANNNDVRALQAVADMYESTVEHYPPPLPSYLLRNLGLAYERIMVKESGRMGQLSRKMAERVVRYWSEYLEVASSAEKGRDDIATYVKNLEKQLKPRPVGVNTEFDVATTAY